MQCQVTGRGQYVTKFLSESLNHHIVFRYLLPVVHPQLPTPEEPPLIVFPALIDSPDLLTVDGLRIREDLSWIKARFNSRQLLVVVEPVVIVCLISG